MERISDERARKIGSIVWCQALGHRVDRGGDRWCTLVLKSPTQIWGDRVGKTC
jgi:hypothetical protein